MTQPASAFSLNGVTPLQGLGVIKIAGDEAAKFIHGQLTQDFVLLGLDSARLSAFCSAKGRMQASFIGFKRPNGDVLLVGSADLVPSTAKRLAMFVMRAKAQVSDASAEFVLWGLTGTATQTIAAPALSIWSKGDLGDASVVNLYPALGNERQLWLAPSGSAAPLGEALDARLWAWSEVHSGVATLSAPVVDAFVPQMLNYESVGGVSFKKGCYPGQEVVARSQFRGTLKRRAYLVHSIDTLGPGDLIYAPDDSQQPVATVVQAAAAPGGGFDAIISGQNQALQGGEIRLGGGTGTPLVLIPLPYALLDDI